MGWTLLQNLDVLIGTEQNKIPTLDYDISCVMANVYYRNVEFDTNMILDIWLFFAWKMGRSGLYW